MTNFASSTLLQMPCPEHMGYIETEGLRSSLLRLARESETGRFLATNGDETIQLTLLQGRLLHAASSLPRERLGKLLVEQGRITPEMLARALAQQRHAGTGTRLGAVLIAMGAVDEDVLESAFRCQAKRLLAEVLVWKTGYWKFHQRPVGASARHDSSRCFDLEKLLADRGVLGDLAKELDLDAGALEGVLTDDFETHWAEKHARATVKGTALASMKAVLNRIRELRSAEERAILLLDFGAQFFDRVVLFQVADECARAVAVAGVEGIDVRRVMERLRFSELVEGAEHSVLREVSLSGQSVRGPLSPTAANARLVEALGERVPTAAVAVPIVVAGDVSMIFYGDTLEDRPLSGCELVEAIASSLGLLAELDALQKRQEVAELSIAIQEARTTSSQPVLAIPATESEERAS